MIITGFQLRASRKVLNLTLEQLHQATGVSKITISRLESTIDNLQDISCSAKDAENLYNYFTNEKLLYPNKNTISLDLNIDYKPIEENLTKFQFIVARVICRISQHLLSKQLGIHYNTVYRLEKNSNESYLNTKKEDTIHFIHFFEKMNINFPDNKTVYLNT